jgi:hypothetical protein
VGNAYAKNLCHYRSLTFEHNTKHITFLAETGAGVKRLVAGWEQPAAGCPSTATKFFKMDGQTDDLFPPVC